MKITAIEIVDLANIPVKPPLFKDPVRSSAKLVKVETDEGLIGVSHIYGPTPTVSAALIKEELTPFLKGKDPLETERLMHHMLWRFNSRGHGGIWNFAVSAIDIALWDIKGKQYKTPVWRLLGGAQKTLPAYITFGVRAYSKEELVEAAKYWVSNGQSRLKIQVGRLNIHGQMDVPGASAEHREDNPAQDEERVRAVREAVGDAVELMVDANCLMKYDAAVRWCKRLEPYNLMWFEEPIVHNDVHLLSELRRQTSIPIAAGARENFHKLSELVVQRAVDYLNVGVGFVGGFTMGMKAAAVAHAFNTPIGNSDQFSHHLHAAVPNGWRAEFSVNSWPVSKVIFRDVPDPVNGWVTLSEKPGLGVEINEDAVREFRI